MAGFYREKEKLIRRCCGGCGSGGGDMKVVVVVNQQLITSFDGIPVRCIAHHSIERTYYDTMSLHVLTSEKLTG